MTAFTTAERNVLVRRLEHLEPADWQRPSLCGGWTIHHVLAHLVTPFRVSTPTLALTALRTGGLDKAMDHIARKLAATAEPRELLAVLKANAASSFRPPGMPHTVPLTDVVAHGADIRWALDEDRSDWGPPARLTGVLDFLVSRKARRVFIPPGRLDGLRLVANDAAWQSGEGAEVSGPGLALVMGMLGRRPAYPLLSGAGVATLAERS